MTIDTRRNRNAKIVATLGPASADRETIEALFHAGADVFRLNFSHGTHEDHKQRLDLIRAIEADVGRPISVLLDLQGPKLRIGTFAGGPIQLAAGDRFRLDLDKDKPGDQTRAALPHPEIFAALEAGTDLLLDDGRVRLRVERCGPDFAETQVINGGPLSDRKGVNVPGVVLPLSALTEKDRKDLDYGLTLGVDWIALSFVQRPEDIREIKAIVQGRAAICAKLEKPAAIHSLEEIVEETDAVMVARGDLGVEMPAEQVPAIQKRIVRACRKAGKPVIVATQMLDSMVAAPVPTRAEASDVATAIYDGADAVMLSAESASGKYPVEAVSMMSSIIVQTEADPHYREGLEASHVPPRAELADAIGCAMRRVAGLLHVAATVAYTSSGYSALRMSRERPEAPIIGMTPRLATARRLALVWGVHSVLCHEVESVPEMTDLACRTALKEGFGEAGRYVVISAGMPFGNAGTTNLLRIAQL
ncbi:pyruvate kinase [Burkholderia guangdongensis]|uniref:pyruvate kinase n=1 Tax=Burkholderia guangdongensis TaxID=1792500 RepID=UPI0015C6CE25|nr:pyruvate kinase [Burkholderia guangdongensis]